jgi:site-specific DNA-cytosine methylase
MSRLNNLFQLPLLEQYIAENGAKPRLSVPFLNRKNQFNVELQNWKDYQDIRKGIITIRQSGIRVKSPDYYPCLTHNPVIPIIYENGYRYLSKEELLSLQSFPTNYQFPSNYSLTKIASLLGNSANVEAIRYFVRKNYKDYNLTFIDLFCGIGAFNQALNNLPEFWFKTHSNCVLAVDNNKSCAETYQLNFPTTPFLLGDINDKKVQQQICEQEFQLLAAGFPCQNFSKAGKRSGESKELESLLKIIQKKRPPYILLETVPQFLTSPSLNQLVKSLLGYQCSFETINPKDFGVKQNRPRLFIWGKKNYGQ